MKIKEDAFRESESFTKEDVIESFRFQMNQIKLYSGSDVSNRSKNMKLEICDKFLKKLETCKLPTLTELYWFYNFNFTVTGIELNLCNASEFEVDEDGLSTMTFSIEHTLLKVEYDYVSVDKFAEIHRVTPVAVRQWIRRGKLRSAKKVGRDWLIPSSEDKPMRGYRDVEYYLEEPLDLEKYPFASVSNTISIWQDDDDKLKFICAFTNNEKQFSEEMILDRKEVEELELALLASGKAVPLISTQFVPIGD